MSYTIEDVENWLRATADEIDLDTRGEIAVAWDRVREAAAAEFGGEAEQMAADALTTAAMYLLGGTTVRKQERAYARACRAAEQAKMELRGAMIAADVRGEPMSRIAAEAGVTRATAYAWTRLG